MTKVLIAMDFLYQRKCINSLKKVILILKKILTIFLILIVLKIQIYSAEYAPGILLIKLETHSQIENIIERTEQKPVGYKYINTSFKPGVEDQEKLYLIKYNPKADMELLSKRVAEISGVKWAEPNYLIKSGGAQSSEKNYSDYSLDFNGFFSTLLETDIKYIQNIPKNNEDIVVAVVNFGIDYTHPDLKECIWINSNETPDNGVDDDGNGLIDDWQGYDFFKYSLGEGDNDPMPDPDPMTGGKSRVNLLSGISQAINIRAPFKINFFEYFD